MRPQWSTRHIPHSDRSSPQPSMFAPRTGRINSSCRYRSIFRPGALTFDHKLNFVLHRKKKPSLALASSPISFPAAPLLALISFSCLVSLDSFSSARRNQSAQRTCTLLLSCEPFGTFSSARRPKSALSRPNAEGTMILKMTIISHPSIRPSFHFIHK